MTPWTPEEAQREMQLRDCPNCSAMNASSASRCVECGETLPPPADAMDEASRRARRRKAEHALREARTWLTPVRALFVLMAAASATGTVLLIVLLESKHATLDTVLPFIVALSISTAVYLAGAILLSQQPLLWTLLLASLQTANVAIGLAQGDRLLLHVVGAGCALVAWVAVPPMARARRLLRQHADLYAAHAFAGTLNERGLGGRDTGAQGDVLRGARQRALWRALAAAAAILAAAATGTWWAYSRANPSPFDAVAQRFEAAWRASDFDEIERFLAKKEGAPTPAELRTRFRRHGWRTSLPAPTNASFSSRGDEGSVVEMAIPDGKVHARWAWLDGTWSMTGMHLPTPSMESFATELRRAWNASDLDALAALYPKERVEKARGSLKHLVARRDWNGKLPSFETWLEVPRGDEQAELQLQTARITVIVHCELDDEGRWRLDAIELPRR